MVAESEIAPVGVSAAVSRAQISDHAGSYPSYTAACAFSSAVLFAILDPLSKQTGLSLDQLNQGTGYQYLANSIGAIILQAASLAFGKKPIYIFSSLASVPVLIWTLYTEGNSQWVANRIMVGLTSGTYFTLPDASIADMYFYHQRAWPVGTYIATTFVATILGPIMGGCVYQSYGWKPVIYVPVATQAATTIFLFFFLEETNYDREQATPMSTTQVSTVYQPSNSEEALDAKDKPTEAVVGVETVPAPVHEHERLNTPWPGLSPLRYRKSSPYWAGIMLRGILQPFLMVPIPIIFWSGLIFGYYLGMFSGESRLTSPCLWSPHSHQSSAPCHLVFSLRPHTIWTPKLSALRSSLR